MKSHEERITLEDTIQTAAIKLCEGNPGGLNVIMQLIKYNEKIDPDAAFGNLSGLLSLDSYGIYGSRIWLLYKDVCGEDIIHMIAVLRAVQLGKMPFYKVERAIDGTGDKLNLIDILAAVQEQLPAFGKVTLEEL